jgi:DNA-binding transcriptional LysR family regulator
VKRAVEIGAGVSIVPRATIEQEVRNGTLAAVEFHGQPYYRPLGIIYKSGRVLSPAMKRFLATLKEPLEELMPKDGGKSAAHIGV